MFIFWPDILILLVVIAKDSCPERVGQDQKEKERGKKRGWGERTEGELFTFVYIIYHVLLDITALLELENNHFTAPVITSSNLCKRSINFDLMSRTFKLNHI